MCTKRMSTRRKCTRQNVTDPFKDTVVNRALASLHGGSLEITLTVPLNSIFNVTQYTFTCFLVRSGRVLDLS